MIALSDGRDCDGCPLSYFPQATTPERARSILVLDALAGFGSIIPSTDSSHRDLFSNLLDGPSFNGRPPFKLLSMLRI
jgi:hypothetical protein